MNGEFAIENAVSDCEDVESDFDYNSSGDGVLKHLVSSDLSIDKQLF